MAKTSISMGRPCSTSLWTYQRVLSYVKSEKSPFILVDSYKNRIKTLIFQILWLKFWVKSHEKPIMKRPVVLRASAQEEDMVVSSLVESSKAFWAIRSVVYNPQPVFHTLW